MVSLDPICRICLTLPKRVVFVMDLKVTSPLMLNASRGFFYVSLDGEPVSILTN